MKQLEDRIKERLEGYKSSLPEGDLVEFKTLLDASASTRKKRVPAYLTWFAPVVAAAGLALFFVFGYGPQQDIIQLVDSSSLVADSVEAEPAEVDKVTETEPVEDSAAVSVNPTFEKRARRPGTSAAVKDNTQNKDAVSDVSEHGTFEQVGNERQLGGSEPNGDDKQCHDDVTVGSSAGYSPFVPSYGNSREPVSVKVGKTTAGVIGGAAFAAVAGMLPTLLTRLDSEPAIGGICDPGWNYSDPKPMVDRRTWSETHHMPIHAGISVRIPFTDRWSLTTGLDYSCYASEIEYYPSGIHNQSAHYLGVPLRSDFTIARHRWMDVYVGAGGSVDFCVAAFDAGQKIAKDGVGISLIGACGIQFNINKNLGLFLDPTLSWDITSGNRTLYTYRSEDPFMFAVSTGLRFTAPTKKE